MRLATLIGMITWGTAAVATAQDSAALDAFRPAELATDGFAVSRPTVPNHMKFGAQLVLEYANDPLVYEATIGDTDSERISVVEHQLVGHLVGGIGLFDKALVYVGVPINLVMDGDTDGARLLGQSAADGATLGDPYLGARARLVGEPDDLFGLGAGLTLALPLSNLADDAQRYAGDETVGLSGEVTAEVQTDAVFVTANLGARFRGKTEIQNLELGSDLTWAVGVGIPIDERRIIAHVEAYGATPFADFGGREVSPVELLAGLKLNHESGLVGGLAAGPGITRGYGSPDIRVIATVGWVAPTEAEPVDEPVVGPSDRDGDGLIDDEDQCPDEPEDADQFEDENGCPDPDNDGDGVLDTADECPLEPEDADGWEDENGCPDPDNDGDGILDGQDECPNEAGPLENRGCPDSDRDSDTVVDRVDNCPDEPGPPENHGCQEEQLVQITDNQLVILDKVYFRTNRDVIQRRSYALLSNVASVLNAHPEIGLVRVEGHTDSRGRRQYNIDLSQRRANAVVRYLVRNGNVDSSRLQGVGIGPDRPVVPDAHTPDDHAQNRRVEFNLGGEVDGVEQRNSGATSDTIDY